MKKRNLLALLFACILSFGALDIHASTIKDEDIIKSLVTFYKLYCNEIATDLGPTQEEILNTYLSPEARQLVFDIGYNEGYDILIDAQDFHEDQVCTIQATHVVGDWYTLSYVNYDHDKATIIPVRVSTKSGSVKIVDITVNR